MTTTPGQVVRSIQRRCKGPAIFPPEVQRAYFAQIGDADPEALLGALLAELQTMLDPALAVRILAYARAARDTRGAYHALVATLRIHATDVGRSCGYDVNDLICAHPFDGQAREVTCPRCGTVISYRAPRFDA